MSTHNDCCATTGELRKVVEEVAEKAAQSAVEKMHLQLRLDLSAMEQRISNDVSDVIDDRIQKALGMTPQDHVIQHDRLRRTGEFFGDLRMSFWKKGLMLLIFAGIAFLGGYSADLKSLKFSKTDQPAITRDEYQYPRKESNHAPES